jgi:hypothetical protein
MDRFEVHFLLRMPAPAATLVLRDNRKEDSKEDLEHDGLLPAKDN